MRIPIQRKKRPMSNPQTTNKKITIFIDGAARGNPGPAGAGIVIKDEANKTIREIYKSLGVATNNVAEYNALIYGLEEAIALGANIVRVHLDSELVAQQLKGEFRVKDKQIKVLFDKAIELINRLEKIEVVHIDRGKNKEADKLANKAINLAGLKKDIH